MKPVCCPPPAPCATTRPATGDLLRYTVSSMRIASLSAALILFSGSVAFGQRLPGTVTPEHYDITVAPRLADAAFGGNVKIRIRLAAPSSTIVLHAAEIKFGAVSITAGGRRQQAEV